MHSGFLDDWRTLAPGVTADLHVLGCANSSISVVGHSLGAAMAALAAYDLSAPVAQPPAAAHATRPVEEKDKAAAGGAAQLALSGAAPTATQWRVGRVYTYGQPRVGNTAFADFYMTGTRVSWRLTHHRDPVPHLPLESMGFHHIGTE